jgi:hypothetical protein
MSKKFKIGGDVEYYIKGQSIDTPLSFYSTFKGFLNFFCSWFLLKSKVPSSQMQKNTPFTNFFGYLTYLCMPA